jgi:hypothetical protein
MGQEWKELASAEAINPAEIRSGKLSIVLHLASGPNFREYYSCYAQLPSY